MMTEPTTARSASNTWWGRVVRRLGAFWRGFVSLLSAPDTGLQPAPAVVPAGPISERRAVRPLAVPARGFAFNFVVYGTFVWTGQGIDRTTLHSLIEHFLPYAHRQLKAVAAEPARGVEPHRGEDFERRLRQVLDDLGDWRYGRGDQQLRCRVYARVQLDERVREHIRPYWETLIRLDFERDIAARRARHAGGISSQWAAILQRLLADARADGAARLTDAKLAEVVKDLMDREAATNLLDEDVDDIDPQSEYEREGYFDLLGERRRRRPAA